MRETETVRETKKTERKRDREIDRQGDRVTERDRDRERQRQSDYVCFLLYVSSQVQIYLYSQLATEFCMQRLGNTSLDLRDVIGVSYLMYVLKEYYSLEVDQRHEEIRPYLILIVKQFVTKVSVCVLCVCGVF